MEKNKSLIAFTEYKIDFLRTRLNNLLLHLEPTNEIVVIISQQLDKYLNDYHKLNSSYSYTSSCESLCKCKTLYNTDLFSKIN